MPRLDRSPFDAAYYRRYYRGADRVHGPEEIARLASGVVGLAGWLGVEVRSVLDVGAGTGLWARWFRRHRPAVRYRATDVSPHACEKYGHERRDISAWRSRERYDLVICHGVLHYLDDRACARAIRNLGAMARGLLYLEAPAREDLAVLDPARSDLAVHLRPADWYRARLARHFVQVGAGLWAARRAGLRLYALEQAERSRSGARSPTSSP